MSADVSNQSLVNATYNLGNHNGEGSVFLIVLLEAVAGVAVNATVITAVLLDANLRKKGFTKMILCLFASSLLTSFSYVALKRLSLLNVSRPIAWKTVLFLHLSLSTVYQYSTCILALSRLLAMMSPVKYKILISSNKIEYLIIVLWILSVANGLPVYYGIVHPYGLHNPLEENEDTFDSSHLLSVMYIAYTFILPGMTSGIAYVTMFVEASRGRRLDANQGTGETRHRVSQWENEITRTLLVIIFVQTSCSVPHSIYHILTCFSEVSSASDVIHIIHYFQFLTEPLVLVTMAGEYRHAVVQMFKKILKGGHVDQTNSAFVVQSSQQVAEEIM